MRETTINTGKTAMTDTPKNTDSKEQKQPQDLAADLAAMLAAAEAPPPVMTGTSATILKTTEFPAREYDEQKVDDFLYTVFHNELEADENILCCAKTPTATGWFAQSEDDMFARLKTPAPKSLYVSTSTFTPDATDGKLYHRQANFKALHLIVLDDIGTKVSEDAIPTDFIPTYKLETSEGNFQWGYVLTKPVTSVAAASALVQMVYESGASDEGGKMPNKWVRMPEGINGKEGKGGFISTLTECAGNTYTPQEIIDGLNLNADWEEVLEDAEEAMKRRGGVNTGSSPWSPLAPTAQALNGFIDPVLEWMYDAGYVMDHDGGQWFKVVCPNGHEHSTGDKSAGYSPIGYCPDNPSIRRFNCFHDSCAANKTAEFLSFIAASGGPEVGMFDEAAALTSKYVFDALENKALDVKSKSRKFSLAMDAFRNMYPQKAEVQTFDGKSKRIPLTSMWMLSKSRVTVHGSTFDASTNAVLVEHDGVLKANLFSSPAWGNGPINNEHVKKFTEYLEYLIPDAEDRHYFIQTLAAKCQDMSFRGTAIVMIGRQQGLGRSTLADMMGTLMGQTNCATVELAEMVGDSGFNEWREKCFVVVEEAKSISGNNRFDAYEKLKTYVDPRMGQQITINPKHERKREVVANSSFLFLSNHANALAIPEGDRRFYVMENTDERASPEYFMELNKWINQRDSDGMESWARSVHRWLVKLDVDHAMLVAPPKTTTAKAEMAGMSKNDIDFAVDTMLENWPSPYITAYDVYKVLHSPVLQRLEFEEGGSDKKFISSKVRGLSLEYNRDFKVRVDEHPSPIRPRVLKSQMADGVHVPFPKVGGGEFDKDALRREVQARELDYDALATLVNAKMVENDR